MTHHTKAWVNGERWRQLCALGLAVLLALIVASRPRAQTFSSGSNGSDGALIVQANQGTTIFDPTDKARWGRVLDPDGDGVYHFTTITINSGSALRLRGDKINKPVHWLASGDVFINSNIDLSGDNGNSSSELDARRNLAVPGAGGYQGGAGGRSVSPQVAAMPGEGPGGAPGTFNCTQSTAPYRCGLGATFTGNRYLVPLVGGSGGAGGFWFDGGFHGGGAGGGALVMASSTLITLNGVILANGGNGALNVGGGGGGGSIRLVAPVLAGAGSLQVNGGFGNPPAGNGAPGWVRLEGLQIASLPVSPTGYQTRGAPVDSVTLTPQRVLSVRVTAIDGISVSSSPTASFAVPDVVINKGTPVNVDVEARGIPPGTVVTLTVIPETPEDPAILWLPPVQATLSGTIEVSTATTTMTFPYGFSRGYVRASWTE